jgi:uncharacterized protein (TIGR02300 family)
LFVLSLIPLLSLLIKEKKMAKPEWGIKRICPSCGTKYYDFKNSPIICPSCGAEFDPDLYLRSRKGKSLSTKVVAEDTSKISEDISDIDEIEIDSDDEVVSDEDPLIEIGKNDKGEDSEEIGIDDNVSFIDDDDLNDEEDNVEIEDTKE